MALIDDYDVQLEASRLAEALKVRRDAEDRVIALARAFDEPPYKGIPPSTAREAYTAVVALRLADADVEAQVQDLARAEAEAGGVRP